MKRLISLIIVVFVVLLASQSVFAASKTIVEKPKTSWKRSAGLSLLGVNAGLKKYLPEDIEYIAQDERGEPCNQDGVLDAGANNNCKDVISPSSKERYRVRFSNTQGDRIFLLGKNNKPIRYVQFGAGAENMSQVVYASEKAQQFAQAHGGQSKDTPVTTSEPAPTAPATPSTPTTSILDCTQGALFDKAQCIAKNAAANKL